MSLALLDNPVVLSQAFYPRPAHRGEGLRGGSHDVFDGIIPVERDIVLGYRLYANLSGGPLILLFHGNGEIAIDYDDIAPYYQRHVNASLLVVDYRGYGWSTGAPTFSALLNDTEAVCGALPDILESANLLDSPLYVMGRSIGSAPALHIAKEHPDRFRGLIIESGFAKVLTLALRWGLLREIAEKLVDPIGNERKIASLNLPLLVIHGEQDTLIPVDHAQRLYDTSPAARKFLLRVPGAGHNDLLAWPDMYFKAIADFLAG